MSLDAVVVGLPDERFGERVVALVALRDGAPSLTLKELQTHCRTKIVGYKVPRVLLLGDVPRTNVGKPDYALAGRIAREATRSVGMSGLTQRRVEELRGELGDLSVRVASSYPHKGDAAGGVDLVVADFGVREDRRLQSRSRWSSRTRQLPARCACRRGVVGRPRCSGDA